MLNRKFLAVALPVVAFAAVVGSGFSAWYFTSQVSGINDTKIGVVVDGDVVDSLGTLKVTKFNDATSSSVATGTKLGDLKLDQLSAPDYKLASVDRADANLGISFVDITKLDIVYSVPTVDLENLQNAKINFTYKITISVLKGLVSDNGGAGYIATKLNGDALPTEFTGAKTFKLDSTASEADYANYVLTVDATTFSTSSEVVEGNTVNTVSLNFVNAENGHNPLFVYTKKPTNAAEVTAMKEYYEKTLGTKATEAIKISAEVVVDENIEAI